MNNTHSGRRARRTKIFSSLVTVLMLLCTLALASPASASATVPFKGSADDVPFTVVPSSARPITWDGEIVATHLGQGGYTGALPFPVPDPDDADCVILPFDGVATFAAADGDELHMRVPASSWSVCGGVPSVVYDIVGGTGRFAGATGAIVVDGVLNFVPGVPDPVSFDAVLHGTIVRP
jgi:hypothetical protein